MWAYIAPAESQFGLIRETHFESLTCNYSCWLGIGSVGRQQQCAGVRTNYQMRDLR